MSSIPVLRFLNCNILYRNQIIREDFWISGTSILNHEKYFWSDKSLPSAQIDCSGCLIVPGLIDVQINGAFGFDFSSSNDVCNQHAISEVARGLLSHGVTAFCPTVVSSDPETYKTLLPRIKRSDGGKHGACILGVHLEGPFISPVRKGAHDEKFLRIISNGFSDVEETYGNCLSDCVLVTLAPEIANSDKAITELSRRQIRTSLGHTNCNLTQAENAVRAGASFVTHLFNAMPTFHHRDPGLVGLLTTRHKLPRPLWYGIIADGVHTHPGALRIAHDVHPDGAVLITDAISAMGLPDGDYSLASRDIEVRQRVAHIAETDTLAGSVARMDECVRQYKEDARCSWVEAFEAATLHPARLLGLEDKMGTLEYGTAADFVIFDAEKNVMATFIAGECVWFDSKFAARLKPIL